MKICPKCGTEYQGDNTLCPADGTALVKTGDDLIGQTLAGKYRIEERLDEGGMGTVYRATHVLMEKTVAIKVLHPSLAADTNLVARFTREAKAASRISHPHALTVTDFGESENGIVFLVMEYLRGFTLKEVIRRDGPLPPSRVSEINRQICGALDAAHREGVVHRDLKSDNIMLEEVGAGQDWAKVLDFGIAKIQELEGGVDPALTAPNLIIGTPQYMSPEQCSQSSGIDARSDIYSLGIILYEMLTGHVPFTGDSPTAIMMKHLQEPAPSVLTERPDLSISIDYVVARALSKRPEDRFQTASQLSEAFSFAAVEESPDDPVITSGRLAPIQPADDLSAIGAPTTANIPARDTLHEERDEATVVSGSTPPLEAGASISPSTAAPPPPPVAGFNPWRIMVPALVLLVMIFGVVYVLQRLQSGAASDDQGAPLTSDPNGQPVRAVAPPSGEGEKGIAPGTATSTSALPPVTGGRSGVNSTANRNKNLSVEPTPLPEEDGATDPEFVPGKNEETVLKPGATPSPTPSRRNANQQPTPPPVRVNPDLIIDQSPPSPPRATPTPKTEPPATTPKPAPPQTEPSAAGEPAAKLSRMSVSDTTGHRPSSSPRTHPVVNRSERLWRAKLLGE